MKYYITTAIDYINGKPHIGHSYEKVASDVLARFYKDQGADVFFLTGTDEHGSKIAQYAEKQGMPEKEFADQTAKYFLDAWDNLNISYDRFIRTTEDEHIKTVDTVMNKMKDNGFLYEGEYSGLYCVGHEAFLAEKELVDGLCPEHKTKPELLTEKNWFLKISAFTDKISEKIQSGEFQIWPEERKNEILSLLKQGFNDVAVTRPNVKWGIPVPWDKSQTVYVWPDALSNYITGVGFSKDQKMFEKYWPADVHVVGKDIIKFHCIIWPAILLACDLPLPKAVVAHGYLTIDGHKISKSLGNVIDPNDWVKKYGSDVVRYFLLREFPWGQDGDVSDQKLKARYEGDLANGLGNLVSRVSNMIEKYGDGKVAKVAAKDDLKSVSEHIKGYRLNEALVDIWKSIAWANQKIDETKPWALAKTDLDEVNKILAELAAQILVISKSISPFMPLASKKIQEAFEKEKITKMEPLFPKIE